MANVDGPFLCSQFLSRCIDLTQVANDACAKHHVRCAEDIAQRISRCSRLAHAIIA